MSENENPQETSAKAEDLALSNKELAEKYSLPEFDGSMSIEQYAKLVQHALVAKAMKPEVLYAEAYAKAYYQKNGGEYKFPTTPLSESEKENALQSLNNSIDIVTAVVQTANNDYEKAGKELPADNDEAYKKAVNMVYTVNVDSNQLKGFGDISIRDELISDTELPLVMTITESVVNDNGNTAADENTAKSGQQNASENSSSQNTANENTTATENAAKTGSTNSTSQLKNTMAKDNNAAHTNSSGSDEHMTRMINYMNKINGKGKEVDAASTVAKLKEKYGDKAEELLVMAITEPTNYAKYTGNASIKTSRAALENLANSDNPQQLQETLLNKKDENTTQTADKAPMITQMQEDSTNAWVSGKKLIEAIEKQNEVVKGALKNILQEEIVVPYAPGKQPQTQTASNQQNGQTQASGQQQTQQSSGTPYAPKQTQQPSWMPVWQKKGGRE